MARPSYAVRIRARIGELEAAIKDIQVELDELRVAERVIERLGTDDEDDAVGTPVAAAPSPPRALRGRTIGELILEALSLYGPMESREIFVRICDYQDTTLNTVSTTLSRLKENRQVRLDGRTWSLAKKEEASSDGSPKEATDGDDQSPDDGFGLLDP